jgi:hypothetical protein
MKITCPKCHKQYDPAEQLKQCPHALLPVGKDLDKALDAFVADKPKDIMR